MLDTSDGSTIDGQVTWELVGPDGKVKRTGTAHNIITRIGDQRYGEAGAGIGSPPAAPNGMKLGTGSTAVAKTGAGAALVTYLTDSHQAFDATFPSSALNGAVRRITYKVTYAAGKANSPSTAITEAVIVNDFASGTNATSAEANTLSRVLLAGIGSKATGDTLTVTWTHDIGT